MPRIHYAVKNKKEIFICLTLIKMIPKGIKMKQVKALYKRHKSMWLKMQCAEPKLSEKLKGLVEQLRDEVTGHVYSTCLKPI